jgi:hypothetical protein
MKPLFIVDIDGTVCDSIDFVRSLSKRFRRHVDMWDDCQVRIFMEDVLGRQAVPGAEVLKAMLVRGSIDVVFLTGRSEKIGKSPRLGRRLTEKWLRSTLGMPKGIPLLMRPPGDTRTPDVIKFEVFERRVLPGNKRRNFVFLDDDIRILSKYASRGLALKSPECWAALSHNMVV